MSAETLRASIDKRTDLPTPEPEKMPIRWPRHMDRPRDFHHQAAHRHNAAVGFDPIDIDDLFGERLHWSAFSDGDAPTINLPLGLPAQSLH